MDDDWETMASEPAPVFENEETGVTGGFDDAWDDEPAAKPAAAAAAAAPKAAPVVKKTPKQIARERELKEAEALAAAAAARRKAAAADAEKMRDPAFRAARKAQELKDIEESEKRLADDLFGDGGSTAAAAAPVPERSAEQQAQAAALASSTGLGDGADNMNMINGGGERSGPQAAPNALDAVPMDTKESAAAFVKILARKLNDQGVSAVTAHLLKELVLGVAGGLKVDDLSDVLRVVTVSKNDAVKAQQNKKKKSTRPQLKGGKATAKAQSSGAGWDEEEEAGDEWYDEEPAPASGNRNGPDFDFLN